MTPRILRLPLLALSLSAASLSWAALTDVSQSPVITARSAAVKPNLLFVIDDSGSMNYTYLPEAASSFASTGDSSDRERYGFRSAQCNGLAYNPDPKVSYPTPLDFQGNLTAGAATGDKFRAGQFLSGTTVGGVLNVGAAPSSIPFGGMPKQLVLVVNDVNASFSVGRAVTLYDNVDQTRWMLGMVTATSKVKDWQWNDRLNVTVSFDAENGTGSLANARLARGWPHFVSFKYEGTQKLRDFTYSATGSVITTSTFYTECRGLIGSNTKFVRHIAALGDAAERQRFADWYTHYRTRINMTKTVVSHAFASLDEQMRVGFSTIHSTKAKDTTNAFLPVDDFTAAHKQKFYNYLMNMPTSGGTPLLGALAFTGRYFGNRATDQSADPMQYSCQKNFALLATDGSWNNGDEAGFGPFKMRKNIADADELVGQQDRSAAAGKQDASNGNATGGSSNSLADVAYYYANTDLRDKDLWNNCTGSLGKDVCSNDSGDGSNIERPQRMVTFTLSLGQDGALKYVANYDTAPDSDYARIVNNVKEWPNPPAYDNDSNSPFKIDDLWHAAVNGDGRYFNGSDHEQITNGLLSTFKQIEAVRATGSAAATATLYPVAGNNHFYVADYTTERWVGDLKAYEIDLATGALKIRDAKGNYAAKWSASNELLKVDPAARTVLFHDGSAMKDFQFANLTAAQKLHFASKCTGLSQCLLLNADEKAIANSGDAMVQYLRGKNTDEVFRKRIGPDPVADPKVATEVRRPMGDIVGSSPAFDGNVKAAYKDAGYAEFGNSLASRKGRLYVGGNDGMLHAIDADTGKELWSFVPNEVMANMHKLASNDYYDKHLYMVDGSPTVADVEIGGSWKRIVIFGLGAGGRAYYALDVTDGSEGAKPKLLWEFKNANLGFTHARPVVTKLTNGKWVVVVPSGFNNVGDGKGHLFVIDAANGSLVDDISTGAGDAATPAGLGPVRGWVESAKDNISLRFYAGDNLGNVWRFETKPAASKAIKIANLTAGGVPQPITTSPTLAEVDHKGVKVPVVFVGTGRLVGQSDVGDANVQSIYAIRDRSPSEGWGDFRSVGVQQAVKTDTGAGTRVTDNPKPVDWSTAAGWFVDLPDARERINISMLMAGNSLVAASNVPAVTASCSNPGGGYSWLYTLNIADGSLSAEYLEGALIVGLTKFELGGQTLVIPQPSIGDSKSRTLPSIGKWQTKPKRANWRELVTRNR